MADINEQTPLLLRTTAGANNSNITHTNNPTKKQALYDFLEARTAPGRAYEKFMMVLIVFNVVCFIVGTMFLPQYNHWDSTGAVCGSNTLCDALFFGNFVDNGLGYLHLGSTSVLELITVSIFTIEIFLRVYTADLDGYVGVCGRLRYLTSFFGLVDLASTLPFYIDAFMSQNSSSNISNTQFLRMFRLLRMMRVEGRFDTALTMVDDVFRDQKGVLGTAGFVGITVWMAVSSCYYLAERRNLKMIYCSDCSNDDGFDPTKHCVIDSWGLTTCFYEKKNCMGCYNLYESIPTASYYALLNLFGEFPHIDDHNTAGKIVGVVTAVFAVAVFALPVGIIGNGFEDVIASRRRQQQQQQQQGDNNNGENIHLEEEEEEEGGMTPNFYASNSTFRGRLYNLLFSLTAPGALALDTFINILVIATALSFMLDTLKMLPAAMHVWLDSFELVAVTIFTVEYGLRVYAAKEDPKYYSTRNGTIKYMSTFLSVVDLLSFLPFWIEVAVTGSVISTSGANSMFVKSLRLLRILRFERYTHAFMTFDNVLVRNLDLLAVTAFTALLFWIFFSSCLYFSERDSMDEQIASYYNNIPNAMWITMLNLSGESPLSQYSFWGKVVTAILGLFATGVFGIPIGVLGAGFEEIVEEENEDNTEELERDDSRRTSSEEQLGTPIERRAYNFVNGIGSKTATWFELSIYVLIILSVSVGALQTVPGQENTLHQIEWVSVIIFTIEYIIRLVGAGADPEFAKAGHSNGLICRLRFIVSFYSIIDLLAIIPFYIALALPNSLVDQYDEYLRMLRILRLVKLDKYVPSITLIDDVFRLKYKTLRVAAYAAVTLWILFAALLFLCEHKDYVNGIDPVPLYGCNDDCTMSDRFINYFFSSFYTGIHLTGDYPIIEYNWPGRFVNFFMVIAAVGVVSIPSGVIASGFVEIVQSKNRKRRGEDLRPGRIAGDDWYEDSYRLLENVDPPPSRWGPKIDACQYAVNDFLNGKKVNDHHEWTKPALVGRFFIFTVIISNVVAVLLESVPTIDKAVGNEPGNFFDRFELFSVMVFATEYVLRLFCAPKNREALYSSFTYATTFFGIVDFLSTAPWFIEHGLIAAGVIDADSDSARVFRVFRIFRILQLEDFVVAFSKLDNVFRASKDVLKATGLMAAIVWVGCGALFFIFEQDNPNWRSCDSSIPLHSKNPRKLGCYDFASTMACNDAYPGMCNQNAFTDMPNSLFYTAVFLGGEWGVVDFTFFGRGVCMFLCVLGIGIYSIPIGTLFDSFGAVLGLVEEDDNEGDCEDTTDAHGLGDSNREEKGRTYTSEE